MQSRGMRGAHFLWIASFQLGRAGVPDAWLAMTTNGPIRFVTADDAPDRSSARRNFIQRP
jgi:hypothetical protein